ncbi:unnamed protein product [Rodentolepis nana]|uniref:Alba domain-containing protein n=1 Tax=Rodentolepis nana TaxID=102285 RepID=A0A0R3TB67_RODNA|nr:unnamed protein product [Rodentolepis nana]
MLLTGEMALTSVDYLNRTFPLIYPLTVQPQTPSSDAQSIILITIIGCAVGIGIGLIRKLIGGSRQCRTIIFAEVHDILNEDYEIVEVINVSVSTGMQAILSEQENMHYFSVRASVLQNFAMTSGSEDGKHCYSFKVIEELPRMPKAIKPEKCGSVVRWENYNIVHKGFTHKRLAKKERVPTWTSTIRTPAPAILCGSCPIINKWASKKITTYKLLK